MGLLDGANWTWAAVDGAYILRDSRAGIGVLIEIQSDVPTLILVP
jgi:hypothetical protein